MRCVTVRVVSPSLCVYFGVLVCIEIELNYYEVFFVVFPFCVFHFFYFFCGADFLRGGFLCHWDHE